MGRRHSFLVQGNEFPLPHLGRALAADSSGNIFVADTFNRRIRKIEPNGNVTTIAGTGIIGFRDGAAAEAKFGNCYGMAVGPDGAVFVSDYSNQVIRKI